MSSVLRISVVAALAVVTAGCSTTGARRLAAKDGGLVELSCMVRDDGSLDDCRIERENPSAQGFGEAALRAAEQTKVTPDTARGAGRDGRLRWRMRFERQD